MDVKLTQSIVLDTNQLVSAILRQGSNSHQVLELVLRNRLIFYYSNEILMEYFDVLYRPKFNFNRTVLKCLLDNLIYNGSIVTPKQSTFKLPDETDRKFYDAAKEVGAVLITGNIKHYPHEPFIQTPSEYLNHFLNS